MHAEATLRAPPPILPGVSQPERTVFRKLKLLGVGRKEDKVKERLRRTEKGRREQTLMSTYPHHLEPSQPPHFTEQTLRPCEAR